MNMLTKILLLAIATTTYTANVYADLLPNPNQNPGYNDAYNQWQQWQNNNQQTGTGQQPGTVLGYDPNSPTFPDGSPNTLYAKPWTLTDPTQANYYGMGGPGRGFQATYATGYTGPANFGMNSCGSSGGNFGMNASFGVGGNCGVGANGNFGMSYNPAYSNQNFNPCQMTVGGCGGCGNGGNSSGACGDCRWGGCGSEGMRSIRIGRGGQGGRGDYYDSRSYGGSFDRDYRSSRSTASSGAGTSSSVVASGSAAVVKPAVAPAEVDCKQKIADGLIAKLGTDFLDKAFNLATYRLAVKVLESKGNESGDMKFAFNFLKDKASGISSDPEYESKLPTLLSEYRAKNPNKEAIQPLVDKSYNASKTSLTCLPNNIIAESIVLSQSGDNAEADAAAIWAVNKIQGDAINKDLSIMWRVDRIVNGAIEVPLNDTAITKLKLSANEDKVKRADSVTKLKEAIDNQEIEVDAKIAAALKAISDDPDLLKCIAKVENCPNCVEASLKMATNKSLDSTNKALIMGIAAQYFSSQKISPSGATVQGEKKICP